MRIEKLRKERALLHRDIAEGIGISEALYSLKINGFRRFTLTDFFKLADFFDISLDYLAASEVGGPCRRKLIIGVAVLTR